MKRTILFILIFVNAILGFGQPTKILLPAPDTTGGKPLMQTLNERKTSRTFVKEKNFNLQQVSDLLWAAFGVNRPNGKRTAPTAMDEREIDIYVCLPTGTFIYDAEQNSLLVVDSADHRAEMGKQPFVGNASVVLAFVVDFAKMKNTLEPADKDFYSAVDVGYISQNVYLYCASENFSTVVLGWIDKDVIKKVLKLNNQQKILLTQCVGYSN